MITLFEIWISVEPTFFSKNIQPLIYMELNFDLIFQFWADQSQKGHSIEYCTVVSKLQVNHS